MSEADRMFAECGASPDDDAPRLVWADLVGGERGELVVLQCDLARGGLSPAEAARRRHRERELLDRHAVEWAGEVATIAKRWSFRRGFVEAATIDVRVDVAHLRTWPLLSSITIDDREATPAELDGLTPYLGGLRGLGIAEWHGERAAWIERLVAEPFDRLRALSIYRLDPDNYPFIVELVRRAPIERLRLHRPAIDDEQIVALLDAAPGLRALEIDCSVAIDRVLDRPLRALRLFGYDEDRTLRLPTETLECLGVGPAYNTPISSSLYEYVAQCRHLRMLELPEDPALDEVIEQLGSRLELLEVEVPTTTARARFHEATPRRAARIAGELRMAPTTRIRDAVGMELLHHAPAATFVLGPPCCELVRTATIIRLDEEASWELPPLPRDHPVFLGRTAESDVAIGDDSVARRHARLWWVVDRHEIEDANSENGVRVNGVAVQRAALRDGDRFDLGDAELQFFTGDDAAAQAQRVLVARRRRVAFERVIAMVQDERCNELAARVSVEPARMPAVANALADCLIRRVLPRPGLYASFSDRALQALGPIRDAGSRASARMVIAGYGGGTGTSALLDLIDRLEGATDRDPVWQRLLDQNGPLSRSVSRALGAGIEVAAPIAETLASLAVE